MTINEERGVNMFLDVLANDKGYSEELRINARKLKDEFYKECVAIDKKERNVIQLISNI
jgi:hypothetical protein